MREAVPTPAELQPLVEQMRTAMEEVDAENLKRIEENRSGFRGRLRERWGEAFDQYLLLHGAMSEIGSGLGAHFTGTKTPLFAALIRTHGMACRVAGEVYTLLENGFGAGAVGRCRTLHELSAIAQFLQKYDGSPEVPDLAERFLAHQVMGGFNELSTLAKMAPRLGLVPPSQDELDAAMDARAAIVAKYGESMKEGQYGWASGVEGRTRSLNFPWIEGLVGLDHLRPYFQAANHEIHADSRGMNRNLFQRNGRLHVRAGASNAGLSRPGQLALIYLQQITAHLVVTFPSDEDILYNIVINQRLDGVFDLFDTAEVKLATDEAALWQVDSD